VLQDRAGVEINPDKTHFYLCGNPKMVESVTNFLNDYNYTKHSDEKPGSLHVEEY
jgi:ferredoxin--NADP+ reductase